MKQWARARHVMACGFCGEAIRKGDPVLFLLVAGQRKKRCIDCTNDPVPDTLPDAPVEHEGTPTPARQGSFLPIGQLVKDWKRAQAGGDK